LAVAPSRCSGMSVESNAASLPYRVRFSAFASH
jgi:hypothetical protein